MNLIEDLKLAGFTEYESRTYLALLREHPATGYKISNESGVPRSMVYQALGKLSARGAVLQTVEEKATLYRPLPPRLLVERLQMESRELLGGLEQELNGLYQDRPQDHLWTLVGRTTVLAYCRQMIQGSTSELMLLLTDPDLAELRPDITAACGRGVDVNAVLIGEGDLGCGQQVRHPPGESELQELTDSLIVVADQQEALIVSQARETSAAITSNRNLVFIARQLVWMELFSQRIYARLGDDLLDRLDPGDRRALEGIGRGD